MAVTRRDAIRARLPSLTGSDAESIDYEIERLIGDGWTDREICRFCRLTEECGYGGTEEQALTKMQLLREEVVARLSKATQSIVD